MSHISLKTQILDLSDSGQAPDKVARILGCNRKYVRRVIAEHAGNFLVQNRMDACIRESTRELGRAVIAAGGHR